MRMAEAVMFDGEVFQQPRRRSADDVPKQRALSDSVEQQKPHRITSRPVKVWAVLRAPSSDAANKRASSA